MAAKAGIDWLVIGISAGMSLLLPIVVICIRETVKSRRQEIIKDLEQVFELRRKDTGELERELIVPSFEFVKFKYFLTRDANGSGDKPRDIPLWAFGLASLPLILSLFGLGLLSFSALLAITLKPADQAVFHFLPTFFRVPVGEQQASSQQATLASWLIVLMAAYFGSYLFTIRQLLRAVSNFDLSPATFLSATVNVLFGVVTAVIAMTAIEHVGAPATIAGGLAVAAFAMGFMPELGLRILLRNTGLRLFKSENQEVFSAFSATPLEAIDGIDSEISSRLSEYHLVSVQNLAAANPIMLFVETPYGVYQIIDWVVQAQLCTITGSQGLVDMWKIGVRTIFDLERAVLDEGFTTPELRHVIGQILLAKSPEREQLGFGAGSKPTEDTDALVVALVRTNIHSLHTQRMRQIWNRIADRLDPVNHRLDPIATGRPKGTKPPAYREEAEAGSQEQAPPTLPRAA